MSDLFDLAGKPQAAFFFAGVIFGFASAWGFINKYIIDAKLEASEEDCRRMMRAAEDVHIAQIQMLQDRLDAIAPIAAKWHDFMERKALEILDTTDAGK